MRAVSILVIDTDTDTCVLLRDVLEGAGFSTIWCNSFASAESAVVHSRPDALLIGISRLDTAELRLLTMVRQRAPDSPVILMSTSPDLREWSERVEAEGFLAKPFDVAAPAMVVNAVLISQA